MQRRHFLQFPLIVPFLAAYAQQAQGQTPQKGFMVKSKQDRRQEELHVMGGEFDLKVGADDTAGAFCLYDTFRHAKGGPSLHVHHSQDEYFYVLKGDFIVKVGDDLFTLGPGDLAFAPRQVPHAFAKTSDDDAEMLVMFQPAGTVEAFFKEMGKMGTGITNGQDKANRELFERHGMEILGPPLKY